jgi:predicted DNA binding protein
MSVIVEFSLSAADFELGRILGVDPETVIKLETLVPLGETTIPLFWVHHTDNETFVESIQRHPAVRSTTAVDSFEDRTLFKLDWDASVDDLIRGIEDRDGYVLNAVGRAMNWEFEVRFRTHEALRAFSDDCNAAGIPLTIQRVYAPSGGREDPGEELTDAQLEALTLAIEKGYYSIPRGCSTKELGDELGISDQAVTERLRRAIVALSTSTIADLDTDA